MKGRPKAGGQAAKAQRRKAAAPKVSAQLRGSSLAKGRDAKVTRLTRELIESREQQLALAEVLGAISRSRFELETVLESVARSAARLCHADQAVIFRQKGDAYRFAVGYSINRAYFEINADHRFSPAPVQSLVAPP